MLQCSGGDDQYDDDGDDQDLPRGDWRSSCRNYHIYGTVLRAECRDQYGRYVQSSIDVRQCRREVSNYGGRLVCGNGGAGGGNGPGRIILYKHTDFGGKTRVYTGDVPDMNQQAFGHTASSAVVQGGVWQLCDQTYYRGNCIIVDRAERNFNSIGFNDRAESLRRVR